jgi:hypothetical protein
MRTKSGKIVFATESELLSLYLDRGYDECMDFEEYKLRMMEAGCEVEE